MANSLLDAAWRVAYLSPVEKVVLVSLACRANKDTGKCWPSIEDQHRRTGASERSVQRALRSLETKGHISIEQRTGTTPMYTVHPRHSDTPTPATVTPQGVPASQETPATVTHRSRHSGTQTVINLHEHRSALKEPNKCDTKDEAARQEARAILADNPDNGDAVETYLSRTEKALRDGMRLDRGHTFRVLRTLVGECDVIELCDWAGKLSDRVRESMTAGERSAVGQ